MTIKIDDGCMRLEIGGKTVATAKQAADGWWEVSNWLKFFDCDRAITALTVIELLETGYGNDDPLLIALSAEWQ